MGSALGFIFIQPQATFFTLYSLFCQQTSSSMEDYVLKRIKMTSEHSFLKLKPLSHLSASIRPFSFENIGLFVHNLFGGFQVHKGRNTQNVPCP